jgi:multidrug efflux pump subunit AcrA (membrane-fusion protein)
MGLRLALLATVFCIGCSEGLPDTSTAKGSAATGGDAVASSKVSEKEKEPEAASAKEGEHSEKEKAVKEKDAKEGEDEVKGHVTVHCVPVQKQALSVTVNTLGRTELLPENFGSLTATVEGHVHKLLVNLGDNVKAGQPVVQLDLTVALTALAEKQATLDSLKAALVLLESRPRPEEVRAAELAVEQGKLAVEHAQAVIERYRPLAARQEVSPQIFADAEHTLKLDLVQRDTALAQLKVLNLGPRPEAVAEAKTKIFIAEQAVASAKALLDLHTLRAPIAGSLDSLTCHLGQTLTVGTPVGEIVNRTRLLVTAYLPARSARLIDPGMTVRLDAVDGENREPAGKSDEINGQVAFVGSVADPQTGNFPARILVDNADGRLRVGQVVKALIKLRTEQAALTVPQAAIFDVGEGPLLAVVRDGKLKQLHPELGTAEGGMVVVLKTDLHEGDMVATDGAYNVKDGTEATIAPIPQADAAKSTETAKAGEPAKAGEHE